MQCWGPLQIQMRQLEASFTPNPHFVTVRALIARACHRASSLQASRVFKRRGPLFKKCRRDDKEFEFLLFNDLLA